MKDKLRKTLDLDRFRTIVEAYGSDPSKWPEAEKEAALSFLAGSSEAATIVDQAVQLDRMLDRVLQAQPSPELERIVAAIPERSRSTSIRTELGDRQTMVPFASLWKSALAASLAVVLGIVTGIATAEPTGISNDSSDWEDFASLAFVSDLDQELSP